jgi:hypothetical protein
MNSAFPRARSASLLMWFCIALFAARVIGQLETVLVAPAWLPDMDAWYSGLLAYSLLLPAQILILMIMAVTAWNRRIRNGSFARRRPLAAGALRIFAAVYLVVMTVRLAVNINSNGVDFWREGAIPVAFHWVLALFLLVAGRPPAENGQEREESEHVAHGDVPALAQPLAHGFGLGKQVRHGDAG